MDDEAWVWSHYTLEPRVQRSTPPVHLSCLVCGVDVPYVVGESKLADHLKTQHVPDVNRDVALGTLLPRKSISAPLTQKGGNDSVGALKKTDKSDVLMAFFDNVAKVSYPSRKCRTYLPTLSLLI